MMMWPCATQGGWGGDAPFQFQALSAGIQQGKERGMERYGVSLTPITRSFNLVLARGYAMLR